MDLDVRLDPYSGCALLVLFEPDQISQRAGIEPDWASGDSVLLSLANAGLLVPIHTRIDGGWLCRLTTGELTATERAVVLQTEDRFWLDVKGNTIVLGGFEAVPAQGEPPDKFVDEFGDRVAVEPGRYQVIVHRLTGDHPEEVGRMLESADPPIPAYVIQMRPLAQGVALDPLEAMPDLSPLQSTTGA